MVTAAWLAIVQRETFERQGRLVADFLGGSDIEDQAANQRLRLLIPVRSTSPAGLAIDQGAGQSAGIFGGTETIQASSGFKAPKIGPRHWSGRGSGQAEFLAGMTRAR